jgi:hypothetical protein
LGTAGLDLGDKGHRLYLNSWKISTLLKENPLKISEFLKNKYFEKENPLKMSEFLKNKCFFNEISPSYLLIPEHDDFLKGKCPSFVWIFEK